MPFAHAGGGLNQRICDVNGQYVRCSGAPDCPTYPMGCGGALVPQNTPTSSHNHRLGVLWVWWVWVGLEVNMTVMRPSTAIHRPGMVQTDGRSYPHVRASENTRKHHHMTGNRSTKHPHCGLHSSLLGAIGAPQGPLTRPLRHFGGIFRQNGPGNGNKSAKLGLERVLLII